MLVAGRMRRYVGHVETAARSDTNFVSVHSGRTLEVGSYSEDAVHCSRSEGWEIVIRQIREIVFRVVRDVSCVREMWVRCEGVFRIGVMLLLLLRPVAPLVAHSFLHVFPSFFKHVPTVVWSTFKRLTRDKWPTFCSKKSDSWSSSPER